MKKNKISSYLIFISFFTVVTVFVLIMQKSYDNLIAPTRQTQVADTSKGINPELDLGVIDQIKNKEHIDPASLPENETATSNVNLSIPTPVVASPSAVPAGPGVAVPTAPLPTLIP